MKTANSFKNTILMIFFLSLASLLVLVACSLGAPDQFAIDFLMPVGTLIIASRSGIVVHVEESGVAYSFPNNLVIVEHEDGTFLQYMHLTNSGAIPEIGNVLVQGDNIGLSGATGSAGLSHLHLVAMEKDSFDYPYISFPTTFKNTEANEKCLSVNKTYTAYAYVQMINP